MKSKILALALLAALSSPLCAVDMSTEAGRGPDSFKNPGMRPSKSGLDRDELRAAVDESQALLDSLGRESLSLPKADHEALYKSLHDDYHLDNFVGKARKSLEQAEQVLDLQAAIKNQQGLLKGLPVASEESKKEESKLLGQQSDLVAAVEALRDTLTQVHQNANVDEARDFDNWIMISGGLLRGRREDREAQAAAAAASPTAQSAVNVSANAEALSAEGISPTADESGTTPTALATPAKLKAAQP